MGKPLTREIAGLVWTYSQEHGAWETPCGLSAWQWSVKPRQYVGEHADGLHPTLRAACEAEVAHREATRASPTLTPVELDRMLEGITPADAPAVEQEAQRRDARAYYRNLAGWAVAFLVLAALCSGVVR